MPAVAKAVLLDQLVQIRLRLMQHDAGGCGGFPLRQPVGFKQRHVNPGRRKDVRHDAADGAAADDGDFSLEMASMLRIGRPPGRGKPIEPVADPVIDFGQETILLKERGSHFH